MKQLVIFSISLCSILGKAQAQFWMEAGVKGLYGTTIPFNSHTFNDSKSSLKITPDYAYGAKLAANFGDNNGVIVDGLFSQSKASYSYDIAGGLTEGSHELSWKNIDIYPMYRHYYERSFIEIGPKISLLQNMTQTNVLANGADAKEYFNAFNYGASFGFGGYLIGSEFFSLSMNFRIDYQISDFISAKGQESNLLKGSYPLPFARYDSYSKTTPITARAGLELAFPIGGVAKAQCGRRVFFIGGNR
jgi:hypothetical protein